MRRLLPALLLVLVAAALLPGAFAQSNGPLIASIAGSQALAPAQNAFYNVTVQGGPVGTNVNYTVLWWITGANTTGANPLAASPGRTVSNKTTIEINITAPGIEEDITLTVSVDAVEGVSPGVNTTASFPITIMKPLILSATFHNAGTTAALNVTVRWYVDNNLAGTSLIKQIAANGDATVTYNYLPIGLAQGQHTVTATADLDHDGVINPARGEVATSTIFYNQSAPLATGWVLLLGIGVFIPVFLVVVAVRRRGER